MKFPKLKAEGLVKAPKGLLPEEIDTIKKAKSVETPMTKFNSIKRTMGKEKNLSKKFKI